MGREDGRLFLELVSGDDSSSNKQRSGLSTDELAVLVMNIIIRDRAIARTNDASTNKLYTVILVEEIERLILRLLCVFRLKGLLYRFAQFGLNVIRKI